MYSLEGLTDVGCETDAVHPVLDSKYSGLMGRRLLI